MHGIIAPLLFWACACLEYSRSSLCAVHYSGCVLLVFFSPSGEVFVNPLAASNSSRSRDPTTVKSDGLSPSHTDGATYETKVGSM